MKYAGTAFKKPLLFAAAFMALPLLGLVMSTIGYRRLSKMLIKLSPNPEVHTYERKHRIPLARLIGEIINRAGRAGPYKTTCLDRSVLLWWVLRWLRISSTVRIGVTSDNTKFTAHAWVEIEGYVVNDRDDVKTAYLPLPDRASPDAVARAMR